MRLRVICWLFLVTLALPGPSLVNGIPADNPITGHDSGASADTTASPAAEPNAPEVSWDAWDVWALKFQGNDTFPTTKIQRALSLDALTQAQVNPSTPTSKFLQLVAERVQYGYRNSGFYNAKVELVSGTGTDSPGTFRIQEGPRAKNGDIRVVGHRKIRADALQAWLTQPQPKNAADDVVSRTPSGRPVLVETNHGTRSSLEHGDKKPEFDNPVWQPEKFTTFTKPFEESLHTAVNSALEQQGFFDTRFTVDLKPAVAPDGTTTTTLVVNVEEEGAVARIGDIKVSGVKNHSERLRIISRCSGDVTKAFSVSIDRHTDKFTNRSSRRAVTLITAGCAALFDLLYPLACPIARCCS